MNDDRTQSVQTYSNLRSRQQRMFVELLALHEAIRDGLAHCSRHRAIEEL